MEPEPEPTYGRQLDPRTRDLYSLGPGGGSPPEGVPTRNPAIGSAAAAGAYTAASAAASSSGDTSPGTVQRAGSAALARLTSSVRHQEEMRQIQAQADELRRKDQERDRELEQMKAEMARMQAAAQQTAALQTMEPNIKMRLDNEPPLWGTYEIAEGESENWWSNDAAAGEDGDQSAQVNRLRTLARLRSSLPDKIGNAMVPQLVVMGDGNTGKSSVLNRFAQFTFTAVSDGICTRRPVRLQLRPLAQTNYARCEREELDAICTLEDYRDGNRAAPKETLHFEFRKSHRKGKCSEPDEDKLRYAVEARAAKTPEVHKADDQRSAVEKHNEKYIMDELVITIEAMDMVRIHSPLCFPPRSACCWRQMQPLLRDKT